MVDALHLRSFQRARELRGSLAPARRVDDHLGDHGVKLGADLAAGLDAGIDRARLRRGPPTANSVPGAGRKPLAGSSAQSRASMAWPSMARSPCENDEPLAFGDTYLFAHQVDADDRLGDGVLDLQARVDLEEQELAPVEQKFRGARGIVAELAGGGERAAHMAARSIVVKRRRRRLLDDLLVAALDRALALEQCTRLPWLVAEHLDLDVARAFQPALEKDRPVAERRDRLAPGAGDRARRARSRRSHDPHAAPAAAGRRLDQHRIADLSAPRPLDRRRPPARRRRAGSARPQRPQLLGRELVAHRARSTSGDGPDPDQPGGDHRLGERGVLGQEPVAGMHGVGSGARAGRDASWRCRDSSRPTCARPAPRRGRPRARTAPRLSPSA